MTDACCGLPYYRQRRLSGIEKTARPH
jgi:hypothetical protein